MTTESVFIELPLDLVEHHPDLFFRLNYTPYLFPSSDDLIDHKAHAKIKKRFETKDLSNIDLVYVYGIGEGECYHFLLKWLKEKKERRLIFLEDELGRIAKHLLSKEAAPLFQDPQVVIEFLADRKTQAIQLEELIYRYPTDRIEIEICAVYEKRKKRPFHKLKLHIFRLSTVAHALHIEALFSHRLLPHLLRNIALWPTSFLATSLRGQFKNIPAIICGAGPSLQSTIEVLKTLEDKALILAGGSAIAALSNQGVIPHFGLALDPNQEEFDRLKIASSFQMPLIYASRLQPDVMNALNGNLGYLHTATGGTLEHYFEKNLQLEEQPIGPELGVEALSVTTIAIALAVEMGCNPILLNGIDLAYTGMQRYAEGVLPSSFLNLKEMQSSTQASNRLLKRKGGRLKPVHTLVKWVMEADCISHYAKQHPHLRFYQVSEGGLKLSNIPFVPLKLIIEKELIDSYDLRSFVHAAIEQFPIKCSKIEIENVGLELSKSLKRLDVIAAEMLNELEKMKQQGSLLPTGKMTILELDFEEEKAFFPLLLSLIPALDTFLDRHFLKTKEQEEESRLLAKKTAKWSYLKARIEATLKIFEEFKFFFLLFLLLPGFIMALPILDETHSQEVVILSEKDTMWIHARHDTVLDYRDFSIQADEVVHIEVEDPKDRIFFRIQSAYPSRIDGQLLSKGTIYLINPSGMVFGNSACIDTSSLYAIAGHLNEQDFLMQVDRFTDIKGMIEILGTLKAEKVILLARSLLQKGEILLRDGQALFASGESFTLEHEGDDLSLQCDFFLQDDLSDCFLECGASESFLLYHLGTTKAKRIGLYGAQDSLIQVSGLLDASQQDYQSIGGTIQISGEVISLESARIDASGSYGGGEIFIGQDRKEKGGCLKTKYANCDEKSLASADALIYGNGGKIILFSNRSTSFDGKFSVRGGMEGGDGGYIETASAHLFKGTLGRIDASAPKGRSGRWDLHSQ